MITIRRAAEGSGAIDPLRRRRTNKGTNVAEAAFLGSAAWAVVPTASVREDYAMKRTRRTIEDVNASIEEQMSRLREELTDLRRSIGDNASDDTKSALRSLQQRVDRLADDARDDRVRHPSFKGMREDKPAKGVKREMPKT